MKTEELKALGLNEEQITEVFKINGQDIEALKNANSTLTAEVSDLKEKLDTANSTIAEFGEAEDVEVIKKEAEDYKKKYEDAEAKSAAEMKKLQLDFAVEKAILQEGGKNAKAIKSLLNVEALESSTELSKDIEKQINALKESDAYLFAGATKAAAVAGSNSVNVNKVSKDDFKSMGYMERLELKRSNEKLYNELKGD